MAEKSSTNVWWYVLIAFITVLFIAGIQEFTSSMLINPDITLSNETLDYIGTINGINLSNYTATKAEIEKNQAIGETNDTGSQSKDFALEFFYARSGASKVGLVVKSIYSFPGFVATLLKIPINSISWIIGILNWFWRIGLLIAVYYFIRAVIT